ncbi:cytosine permease [Bacillus sp. ISL-7]|uniref:purine-cytosine permease family protein n=1 Tax=Bacillus sp. ISL-7 TaxID=2819136 RepID=UPI001BE5542F|nr:cytosine permease [Bacillus sp. ISL-7]MBT2739053.1 cytosine permease [Bacillus sp. ISL-7]
MKIEKYTIDYIPESERHGKVSNLFSIFFSGNIHMTTLVTGALAITYGLNVFWSIIAIVLGTLFGALFMASHAAQGPQLGIPQMIQSRAQFGVIGAVIPLLVVIVMYIGYFATSGLLGAQAIAALFHIPVNVALIISTVIVCVGTIYGYDLIHVIQRYLTIIFVAVYTILTFLAFKLPLPEHSWAISQFSLKEFAMVFTIALTWQLFWAPYVADYSRYLPSDTPATKTFNYSFWGTSMGSIWMMVLGVFFTASIPQFLDNSSMNLANLFGPFSVIVYLVLILGVLDINIFNLYGAFMATITCLEPFTKLRGTTKVRASLVVCIAIISTTLALAGKGDFIHYYSNFVNLLLYVLIPWTSINLVDYYFVRHGKYNVKAIFDLNGEYGKVNWLSILAYTIGVFTEIPFIDTSLYKGPLADLIKGIDVTWFTGMLFSGILYYVFMKKKLTSTSESKLTLIEDTDTPSA